MNFVLGFILLLVLVASGSAVTSKIIYDFQGENPKKPGIWPAGER